MQQSREKQKIINRPDAALTYRAEMLLYSQNLQYDNYEIKGYKIAT